MKEEDKYENSLDRKSNIGKGIQSWNYDSYVVSM